MELLKYIGMRWWLAITLATGACVQQPTSSTDVNAYSEDVGRYRTAVMNDITPALDTLRPVRDQANSNQVAAVPVPATHDQTASINALLDSISSYNARIPYVEGFTILVYSGTNRERATLVQREVSNLGYSPVFQYSRPNFKVKVGRFTDRLEARRMHLFMKQHFPTAIMVPERIILQD